MAHPLLCNGNEGILGDCRIHFYLLAKTCESYKGPDATNDKRITEKIPPMAHGQWTISLHLMLANP